ncbi:MAG: ferredoxin--NADP reductase, partial [Duodenibacillus sp.]|nr:ferredoxin--NADP reductase [Duodenibacillus sp.]
APVKAGDEVLIDPEAGGMLLADRLAPGGKHLWLFASGTGIAPFMGIIRDEAITRAYERIILVHGVRTWDETEYASRMITPQDKLIKLCSVTRVKDAAVTERIPAALASGKLEELAGVKISKADSRVMLCGNPALVKAVREHMKGLGIASPRGGQPGELLAENFWL